MQMPLDTSFKCVCCLMIQSLSRSRYVEILLTDPCSHNFLPQVCYASGLLVSDLHFHEGGSCIQYQPATWGPINFSTSEPLSQQWRGKTLHVLYRHYVSIGNQDWASPLNNVNDLTKKVMNISKLLFVDGYTDHVTQQETCLGLVCQKNSMVLYGTLLHCPVLFSIVLFAFCIFTVTSDFCMKFSKFSLVKGHHQSPTPPFLFSVSMYICLHREQTFWYQQFACCCQFFSCSTQDNSLVSHLKN